MARVCIKCGYARQPSDSAPEYECPKCGVVYVKAEAALRNEGLASDAQQVTTGAANEVSMPSDGNERNSCDCSKKPDHRNQGLTPVEVSKAECSFPSTDDDEIPPLSVNLGIAGSITLWIKRRLTLVAVAMATVTLLGIAYTFFGGEKVEGQAFIVTKGRENIRLGGMDIQVFKKSDYESALSEMRADAAKTDTKLRAALAVAKRGSLDQYLAEIEWQLAQYKAQPRYPSLDMGKMVAIAKTDANGEFKLEPLPGDYVFAARAKRSLPSGKDEIYRWMFNVDSTGMKKRVLITNANLLDDGDTCVGCVVPVPTSDERIRELEFEMDFVELQLEGEREKEAIRQAGLRLAIQMQVDEAKRQAEITEKQAIADRRERLKQEIDKLRESTPDFDSSYRAPAGCQSDNPPMSQLLACGRARADAKKAHDERYAAARFKLRELEEERRSLERSESASANSRSRW